MFRFMLTPFVIIELAIAYFFVSEYGFLALLLEVIVSGVLGLALIFQAGFGGAITRGGVFSAFGDGAFSVLGLGFGGLLLFMPGLLSDSIGVLVILISLIFKPKMINTQNSTYNFTYSKFETDSDGQNTTNSEIIDVEIVKEDKKLNR